MRDSALKPVTGHLPNVWFPVVGEELMRDSALKRRKPRTLRQTRRGTKSEKSSCATAL